MLMQHGHVADQRRLRIPTQTLLQEQRKLWISKRNMCLPLSQTLDTHPKSRQTQIDILCFLQSLASRSSLLNPLTACQINQIQDWGLTRSISELL